MIYLNAFNNKTRYALGNCHLSENTLIFFGINPSIASPDQPDPTWTRIQRYAQMNDYAGALLLNIYPRRATDYQDLPRYRMNRRYHQDNLDVVTYVTQAIPKADICCAWGNLIEKRPYFLPCLENIHQILYQGNYTYYSIGSLTRAGHPRHPLARGKQAFHYNLKLQSFDLPNYLKQLGLKSVS